LNSNEDSVEPGVDVRALGTHVGLDIAPEYRAGVAAQFIALMSQADLVLGLPLPDELEPGPVFLP
jgi:uncharacterized ferredoxin-like protein